MTYDELTAGLAGERLHPELNPEVRRLAVDSRQVESGDLFVAQVWPDYDASPYALDAVERGAVGLVLQRDGALPPGFAQHPPAVPALLVEQSRATLAALANRFNGYPTERLQVVAITGTNGKTTTTLLLEGVLWADERPCGVIGTLFFRLGGWEIHGRHTTPQADQLFALLRTYLERGAVVVVMEASSHGLALQRLDGVLVDVAVFTNLSHDHLDFHGDFENYFAAKKRLFTEFLPAARAAGKPGVAVINVDDERGRALVAELEAVVTYALDRPADVTASALELSPLGTRFVLRLASGAEVAVALGLVGRHNVANALAAAAAAEALGVSPARIAAGLAATPTVRGRLERVVRAEGGGPTVFVDYSHTPDALEHALRTLRSLTAGRLLVAFGCGGDRDAKKRPVMGRLATELADVAVVTSDNPRSESPEAIAEAILEGVRGARAAGARAEVSLELDRRRAIAAVVAAAGPDDVVLIAGKGHETTQEIAGVRLPFDDVAVSAEALAAWSSGEEVAP